MRLRNPFNKILLNDGEPTGELDSKEMAASLKRAMSTLKGSFIESERSRVAYERMQHSEIYQDFLKLSNNLKTMNLSAAP
jgi:hypothetical protein